MVQSTKPTITVVPPSVSIEQDGDRVVAWFAGEHDRCSNASSRATLAQAIRLGNGPFVIDMSGVTFADGSTVDVLVAARTFLRAYGRTMSVRDPSPCVTRLLNLCGMAVMIDASSTFDAPTAAAAS